MKSRRRKAEKRQRLRDFRLRANDESPDIVRLAAGGEVAKIHPLADEHESLAKLGIEPNACFSVDGYWAVLGDVVFLQVCTVKEALTREAGLYARVARFPPSHVNLVAVVDEPYVTRATLEQAARDFLRVGWRHVPLTDKLIKLRSRPA